jgi:hypothetical protein
MYMSKPLKKKHWNSVAALIRYGVLVAAMIYGSIEHRYYLGYLLLLIYGCLGISWRIARRIIRRKQSETKADPLIFDGIERGSF